MDTVNIILIGTIILLLILTSFLHTLTQKFKSAFETYATQIDDSQNILIKWQTNKPINRIKIKIKHNEKTFFSITLSDYNASLGFYTVPAYYGKHQVIVQYQKGIFCIAKILDVAVKTDKYVIAPLTATLPTSLFTLSLSEITNNYSTPTFVWFKRVGVWDYSKMKSNIHLIPVLDASDLVHDRFEGDIFKKVSRWIKELYDINPNSKFELYYNDQCAYAWMEATIVNNIPKENFEVVLLSDGPSSFLYFNGRFKNENDFKSTCKTMKNEYEALKINLKANANYLQNNQQMLSSGLNEQIFVMLQEEKNIKWWLTKIYGEMSNNNEKVYAKLLEMKNNGKIILKDQISMLNGLTKNEQYYLKSLYNLNSELFEKSINENKKTMVILGTWTQNEHYFSSYINILKKLYEKEYAFFYKGHPNNPTDLDMTKKQMILDLNLADIDTTIPAELIFFFNPDIFASGYSTSTLYSVSKNKVKALFNMRRSDLKEDYINKVEVFISKVNKADNEFGSLVENETSYLIEFTNNTDYDIAIFDETTNKMNYYKKQNDNFIAI